MFTGLIEDIGTIASASRRSDAVVFSVRPTSIDCSSLVLGESIAINGVCLTVTERSADRFTALAGAETLRRTTLGRLRSQSRVNLERAMRVGDRFGGHLVAGHVDVVGQLAKRRDRGANLELVFRLPSEHMRYVVAKGSVCVDGISLTVNAVTATEFQVALIPHTCEQTTLRDTRVGDEVNIEVDIIGKYVEKLVDGYRR